MYEEIQDLYASIGRMYELHYVKGLYTREFYENHVNSLLEKIDSYRKVEELESK